MFDGIVNVAEVGRGDGKYAKLFFFIWAMSGFEEQSV